ncbi:S-layer family protein, partial [Nostoc cf. edaphicum LEGE 07299]|nr:S-layer family protein [Nostoc cf. edaphicum LEGE 07299]
MAGGTVGLNVNSSSLLLSFPDDIQGADVSLNNGTEVNVRADGGGNITINAQNLSIDGESKLQAGIADNLRSLDPKTEDIDINATATVDLNNSPIANLIVVEAVGKEGDINITPESVSFEGQGNINLRSRDFLLLRRGSSITRHIK